MYLYDSVPSLDTVCQGEEFFLLQLADITAEASFLVQRRRLDDQGLGGVA